MLHKICLSLLVVVMLIAKPAFGTSISCTQASCLNSIVAYKLAENGNIYLIGPMASGKTTIGRVLAQRLNVKFIDSDQEIENSTGMTIKEIFSTMGEKIFREIEENMIEYLIKRQNIVLSTGGGSILSENTREKLSHSVVIYLNITVDTQLDRLKNGTDRPLVNVEPGKLREALEKLAKQRNPLYAEIADLTICNDNLTVEDTISKIINYLH